MEICRRYLSGVVRAGIRTFYPDDPPLFPTFSSLGFHGPTLVSLLLISFAGSSSYSS